MPARRTRSGRAAPVAPMKRIRTKGGCLTCRIRRKKCDESRDHGNGGCETCARLHIECLGYSTKRPDWLKGSRVDDYKRKIKHFLADHNAKSSSRGQDDAFLYLNHLREAQAPPRHHSESAHSDTDSDVSSCVDVKFQDPSPSYVLPSPATTLDIPSSWNWPYDPSPVDPYSPWPQVFCPDHFGSDDAEGSPVSEESAFALPVLVDLPTLSFDMQNTSEHCMPLPVDSDCPLPEEQQPSFQMVVSPYEQPAVEPAALNMASATWSSYFASLYYGDPLGVAAVSEALGGYYDDPHHNPPSEEQLHKLAAQRQLAMNHLLKSNYAKAEARALTSMWMMTGSLCQGAFDCWGDCLDIVLDWMSKRLPTTPTFSSSAFSSLEGAEQDLFSRGLWSDLVASATKGVVPCCIELYRKVLSSTDVEVLGCPNKVALAFAETASVAAHPDLIPQARTKLEEFRQDLQVPDDLEQHPNTTKALIHTAGVRLYLETVASRGTIDSPAVQSAVRKVCQLTSNTEESRRAFAFWIFLAGCHTTQWDQWIHCQTLMNEMKAEGKDLALEVASDIMNKVYSARGRGDTSPTLWTEQMRQCRALLI